MPVYHFTLHAYRSWSPAHKRGYTRRNQGYLPPDPDRAEQYDRNANFDPVEFDLPKQEVLVLGSIDLCGRRGWRLHGVGTDASHVHLVVSWRKFLDWREVRATIKNILSLFLGRLTSETGRPWFVRDGSRKRVKNRAHLEYLLDEYLPDHPGPFWREGDPIPSDKYGVLNPRRGDG